MRDFAHIFVTRSTAEEGDGSRISPKVPSRVVFFYNTCIEPLVSQRLREYEKYLRASKGGDWVDDCLVTGVSLSTRVDGWFRRLFGKILGLGDSILVLSIKIKPDKGCNDPRARNSDFVMHVVMYNELNIHSAGFKRFREQCRKIAFSKTSPGTYSDLVAPIPDEVFGRITKGSV